MQGAIFFAFWEQLCPKVLKELNDKFVSLDKGGEKLMQSFGLPSKFFYNVITYTAGTSAWNLDTRISVVSVTNKIILL